MILAENGEYCLLWSGGNASTLLLAMLREQPIDFGIIQFREGWAKNKASRIDKIIRDLDLKVFSYPASFAPNFIDDGQLKAVFEIAVNGATFPVAKVLIDGTGCLLDLQCQTMSVSPFKFDVFITGSGKEWVNRNGVTFWNPIWDYDQDRIEQELIKRGFTVAADNDELSVCHNCIKGTGQVYCPKRDAQINSVIWDRDLNTRNFREVYG